MKASQQARETILVVDDQQPNLQLVGTVLSQMGYEVIPATSGEQAFKRLAARTPDLILLDVLMPDMSGLEVCRQIKADARGSELPIIFLSAADDAKLIVEALECGGVDYVTKPFNKSELITRVRTHLALKRALKESRELAEDKDELLGILTHDLKNHLIGMQLSADLLRDRKPSLGEADITRLCENISRSGGQLLAFVKEFLANAAAERSLTPKLEAVNLTETVAQSVEDFLETARHKDLKLRVARADQNIIVRADRSALLHVLDNLLSNAIKFSPPKKEIVVTILLKENFGECSIQDQGPGFTAEDKARMFRRYARLSARPTGSEPSTGLGLSIVRKLVDAMEGELICESVPGAGANFIVRLPQP